MNLRSRAFYRSGNPAITIDTRSRSSTQERTTMTQSFSVPPIEDPTYETDSDMSMASTSTNPFVYHGVELEYNLRLWYQQENAYGVNIYHDYAGKDVVKVKDHINELDSAPWVNFQGDQFMGREGAMYLLVENPDIVDTLGSIVQGEDPLMEEGPPEFTLLGCKLVNSILTHRVPIDDTTRALYLKESPPKNTLDDEKILYVYIKNNIDTDIPSTIFMDKYGVE